MHTCMKKKLLRGGGDGGVGEGNDNSIIKTFTVCKLHDRECCVRIIVVNETRYRTEYTLTKMTNLYAIYVVGKGNEIEKRFWPS